MTDTDPDAYTCIVCRRTRPEKGYTCQSCRTRTRRQLNDLPELYIRAGQELVPGAADGTRGSEPSIGVRLGALELRAGYDVLGVLGSWERIWREDFCLSEPPGPAPSHDPVGTTLLGVVRFLNVWLDRAADSHPAFDDFAGEVAVSHAKAVDAARVRPRQAWVVSCPTDTPTGRCGASLRVTGEDFGSAIACRRCHTMWDVMRLLHVAVHDAEATMWLPASEIELLYGVGERRLQRWAKAGLIRRDHGRYDVASVRSAFLSDTPATG